MGVDVRHHRVYLLRRSSAAWAKNADAVLRISVVRVSSRFSRSNATNATRRSRFPLRRPHPGGAGRCSSTSRTARSRTSGENRLGRPIDLILPRNEVSENPGTLHEEITEFASRTIDPTIVVAGSRRLLIRPASWVERDGQLLTWSAIGRCGIGVGSHITRLWTR